MQDVDTEDTTEGDLSDTWRPNEHQRTACYSNATEDKISSAKIFLQLLSFSTTP